MTKSTLVVGERKYILLKRDITKTVPHNGKMMDYILTGEADAVNKAEKHMGEFVSENKEKNTVSFRFPFAFKTASKGNTLIFEINRDDMIFISDLFE